MVFNSVFIHLSKVVFVLCLPLITVKTDNFCDSYNKNSRKLIVFKYRNQQNLLIIGSDYWFLEEKGEKLEIVGADRVPNSSPVLNSQHSFAVRIRNFYKDKDVLHKEYGTAFYRVLNKCLPFNP